MTALQTERTPGRSGSGPTPACGAKTNVDAFHGAYMPQIVRQYAQVGFPVTDAETDCGLDLLMALPETAEWQVWQATRQSS
jgi:hypothetical protein